MSFIQDLLNEIVDRHKRKCIECKYEYYTQDGPLLSDDIHTQVLMCPKCGGDTIQIKPIGE